MNNAYSLPAKGPVSQVAEGLPLVDVDLVNLALVLSSSPLKKYRCRHAPAFRLSSALRKLALAS